MTTLKANDKVMIIAGNHKGKTAKIVKIDRKNGKAMLENINVVERHLGKTPYRPMGGKKTVHVGIDLSNLKLVEASKYEKPAEKKGKKAEKPVKKAEKTTAKAKKGAK